MKRIVVLTLTGSVAIATLSWLCWWLAFQPMWSPLHDFYDKHLYPVIDSSSLPHCVRRSLPYGCLGVFILFPGFLVSCRLIQQFSRAASRMGWLRSVTLSIFAATFLSGQIVGIDECCGQMLRRAGIENLFFFSLLGGWALGWNLWLAYDAVRRERLAQAPTP